ncbi:hypothetical protein [Fluviicola taffensis]|uniref:hypothetical protein n=1 Tax=Fluviicola taffensis TaxID=191579 RepID=UPI003137EC72
MYTREQIEVAVKAKGYVWFSDEANKNFDVNIVGIRNKTAGDKVTNVFDDFMTISYKEDGIWKFFCWNATTDPGKKAVVELHNTKGVAILKPGQYRGAWTIGKHNGKYDALCQRLANVTVFRDANKDQKYDFTKEDTGIFGINIHKSGEDSTWVENWSEGCQVFKRAKDFDVFMSICARAKAIHGNAFSYALLESTDIK